jgi:hypothetical protein
MSSTYEVPTVSDLGSLTDLTAQQFNKIGPSPDALTQVNEDIVGSLTPFGP